MKVTLRFLDDFNCFYNSSIPVYADEDDTQIGTCHIKMEDSKHFAELNFNDTDAISEDSYLSCKWHIAENELLTIDKILLTEKVLDAAFSIRLKDAIV